jgi:hypothetical protein
VSHPDIPPQIQPPNPPTRTIYADISSSGTLLGSFGVAIGTGALFIFGEVPRVRNDILRQLPFLDTYYDRSIPAEDNVSRNLIMWFVRVDADMCSLFSPSKLSADIYLFPFLTDMAWKLWTGWGCTV